MNIEIGDGGRLQDGLHYMAHICCPLPTIIQFGNHSHTVSVPADTEEHLVRQVHRMSVMAEREQLSPLLPSESGWTDCDDETGRTATSKDGSTSRGGTSKGGSTQ